LVEMVEVGCGRPGAVWLLHFDAARVDPLAASPLDELSLRVALQRGGAVMPWAGKTTRSGQPDSQY